ncbi:MAG: tRNA (adenosine(37)-N6)-threonylcarbamoyltransferase complex ATPase subunit type 1 TsaE [Kiloniella sp.]|nr:tRNA (adenosine(37)-N6)-threonylcarbamoyltransferase complex ATPase subunit type 1 TsaE [Kiloniella sp.]RZO29472.1 MAG: tRNA (adenosine(37)-N6)-threonylcarbamoyltransferase complex ATPase subunit type 1 TsaE [Rhodospirillaceae bacterium]
MDEPRHDLFRITVETEAGTGRVASALGECLRLGDCVLLQGDLGAGKTAFARALIRSLAGDAQLIVPSPTFTLSQIYDLPDFALTHFDLYRLGEAEDVFDLGWDDARADGVTLVEWPERLGSLAPPTALLVRLDAIGGRDNEINEAEGRQICLCGNAGWKPRLELNFS